MPLANIEQAFIQSLVQPPENDDHFLSQLSLVGNLTPAKQLTIYRSNINGAHQKVLGEIYPACLNILGEDYFNQLCHQYRLQHPSIKPDLNQYGGLFSEFLHRQIRKKEELVDFNYLPDLAVLEWHWHASYFTENDSDFNFEDLQQLPVEQQQQLCFQLSEAFSLHRSIYPVIEIWQANRGTPESQQNFSMPEKEIYYTIYRTDYAATIKSLSKIQFSILTAIAKLQNLQQLNQTFGLDFQQQLVYLIQQGWITGFFVKE